MKSYAYKEVVPPGVFDVLQNRKLWNYIIPVRRKYRKHLPEMVFAVGEETSVVVEAPTRIIFRKRFSLKRITKEIRMTYLIKEEGNNKPYLKLYFK